MAVYEVFHGPQPLMMAVDITFCCPQPLMMAADKKIPQTNILVNFREKMGNGRIKWQWKSF